MSKPSAAFPTSRPLRAAIAVVLGAAAGVMPNRPAEASPPPTSAFTLTSGSGTYAVNNGTNTGTITQTSSRAIYSWTNFNTAAGDTMKFNFSPTSGSGVALNLISGGTTTFGGNLQSTNIQVWLLNPQGFVFNGGGSQVLSAPGLLIGAMSADAAAQTAFMAGTAATFTGGTGGTGINVQSGTTIKTTGTTTGYVVLAGDSVANAGTVTATKGRVILAGTEVGTVSFDGSGLIQFALSGTSTDYAAGGGSVDATAAVDNQLGGAVNGASIVMQANVAGTYYANAVNNSGVVRAYKADNSGGVIQLLGGGAAGSNPNVLSAGTLNAGPVSPSTVGGSISVASAHDTSVTGTTVMGGGSIGLQADSTTGTLTIGSNLLASSAVFRGATINLSGLPTLTITSLGVDSTGAGSFVIPAVSTLAANVSAPATGFTYTRAAPLTIGTVASIAGVAGLPAIAGVSGITTSNGTVVVQTTFGNLTVGAPIAAGSAGVGLQSAGALSLGANLTASTANLHAVGALTQSAGTISATNLGLQAGSIGTLTTSGVSTLAAALTGAGNGLTFGSVSTLSIGDVAAVGTVGALSGISDQNGQVAITSTGDLTVNRGISVGTGSLGLDSINGKLTIGAGVIANSAVFVGTAGVAQTGGTLTVPTLAAWAGTAGAPVSLSVNGPVTLGTVGVSNIGPLSGVTANNGAVTVSSSGDMQVNQPVHAGTGAVALQSGGALSLAAAVAAGSASLQGANGITQTAGTITTPSLTAVATAAAAPITLDSVTASGGTVTLGSVSTNAGTAVIETTGGANLTVSQPINVGSAGLGLQSAGALSLGANLTASTANLHASGALTQSAGRISAASLGLAAGSVGTSLATSGVSTLAANLTGAGSGLTFGSVSTLSVGNVAAVGAVGAVSGVSTNNGPVAITSTGDLTVNSGVSVGTGSLGLDSTTGALTLAAGVAANSAVLVGTGGVTQTGGTLTAPTLAAWAGAAGAPVSLAVTGPVTLGTVGVSNIGPLSGVATNGGAVTISSTGDMVVGQPVHAGTGTVALQSSGTLTTSAAVSSATSVAMTSTGALDIGGAVNGGTVGLDSSAGTLTLAADVAGSAANLQGANGITQTSGKLTTPTLSAVATGTAAPITLDAVTATGGTVTLGSVSTNASNIVIETAGGANLALSQPIDVGAAAVGLQSAGALTLGANLTASTANLHAGGALTQSAGTISATNLALEAGSVGALTTSGVATLAADVTGAGSGLTFSAPAALSVGTVAAVGAVGAVTGVTTNNGPVAITSTGALSVGQAVTAGTGTVGLDSTGGALSLAANVTAGAGIFEGASGVTQSGGTLTVPVLAAAASGSGAPVSLSVTGPVTISTVPGVGGIGLLSGVTTNNGAVTISSTGNMAVDQKINSGSGAIALQSGGTLTTNAAVSSTSTVAMISSGSMDVGTVTADSIGLESTSGTLTLTGNITATSAIFDGASGIAQTGTLQVPTIAASATGAGAPISLSDVGALTVGSVAAVGGVGALSGVTSHNGPIALASTGDMTLSQLVNAGSSSVALTSAGGAIIGDTSAPTVNIPGGGSASLAVEGGSVSLSSASPIVGSGTGNYLGVQTDSLSFATSPSLTSRIAAGSLTSPGSSVSVNNAGLLTLYASVNWVTLTSGAPTAAAPQISTIEGSKLLELPSGAVLDTSISLFELVDPRLCMPADQREDPESSGCAGGGKTGRITPAAKPDAASSVVDVARRRGQAGVTGGGR